MLLVIQIAAGVVLGGLILKYPHKIKTILRRSFKIILGATVVILILWLLGLVVGVAKTTFGEVLDNPSRIFNPDTALILSAGVAFLLVSGALECWRDIYDWMADKIGRNSDKKSKN